ncbi:hypothetical protein [Parachitinimonas caeni]|uniref:Uncharacterized protein n=1 Tax=Parachitinimonas caeni TaxID=3031301 RepID=A0ABT7DUY7_9NEIS|nr:hypothetical protein [Parachitinimonas caeni]MDK2123868.1 hypothetical protein [Parachitinimonas caeni]
MLEIFQKPRRTSQPDAPIYAGKITMQIPDFYLKNCPPSQHQALQTWWASLGVECQAEIGAFLELESPDPILRWASNINDTLRQQEAIRVYTRPRGSNEELFLPSRPFYDTLINHEIYLDRDDQRTHICKAHRALREQLLLGRIDLSAICWRNSPNCPMQALRQIHGDKYLYLSLTPT